MDYIYIGKFVDTHGIKGELRLLLDDIVLYNINNKNILRYDEIIELLFKNNNHIYVGTYKEELIITSYRHHKNYEMLTFEGLNNINDVLKYKKESCYISSELLNSEVISLNQIIEYDIIYKNENYGKIIDYQNNNGNIVLKINYQSGYYVPFNNNFILNVDREKKEVIVDNIEGLIL